MNHLPKPDIVITGAGGLLGHPLCRLAKEQWTVHAVYRCNRPIVPGITAVSLDLTHLASLKAYLQKLRPKAVIHTAANANVPHCEAHPETTEAINVAVPARLAEICADLNITLLFISTDHVFDGLEAPYDETSPPNPVGHYGDQKMRAEEQVLRHYPGALVCRLPLLFGLAPYAQANFTFQMLAAIANHRPLNLFVDEYRTPLDTHSAARGILQVMGRTHGILHLGGNQRVSRFELGLMMAKAMNARTDSIRPTRTNDMTLAFRRAPDCSLESNLAHTFGFSPSPLQTAVAQLVQRYLDFPKENLIV